jgi:hypothetical protein
MSDKIRTFAEYALNPDNPASPAAVEDLIRGVGAVLQGAIAEPDHFANPRATCDQLQAALNDFAAARPGTAAAAGALLISEVLADPQLPYTWGL